MGKLIPLTRGKYAVVDDEDFEFVSRYKWYAFHSKGIWYAARKAGVGDIDYKYRDIIFMHKFLLNTRELVDHGDKNGLNNSRSNLRKATYSQNNVNRTSRRASSSKYLGVIWDSSRALWQAKIGYDGKTIHLGRFRKEVDAAKAYDAKALELYGEFANLNFSEIGG